jgi:predicted HicB family RNase H-like nuclease
VGPAEKKYRKPSHRQLGLRMDKDLEVALVASAAKSERSLSQEARYGLKIYLGLSQAPAEADTSVSA